jgi:signal transduction histidine kinase
MPHSTPISSGNSATTTLTQRIFAALVNPPARSRLGSAVIVVGMTGLIGWIYMVSGGILSRQAFYIIPMILAVSWLGLWWGLGVAFFSAGIRLYGDFAFGGATVADMDTVYNALANRLSLLLVNIVVILVLNELYLLTRQLEQRVKARTAALEQAVAARERLQASLFEAGVRERGAIGRDLHDGLGQHLTATAMAANILSKRLASQNDPLATDARAIESLIKTGIDQTRQIARGILLESVKPAELISELEELADTTARDHRIPCVVTAMGPAERLDVNTASHLFYIAREAVRNALRHGGATNVAIHFSVDQTLAALTVTDNGRGMAPPDPSRGGMGVHIMAQRAELIGGKLQVAPVAEGGTCVDCRIPLPSAA